MGHPAPASYGDGLAVLVVGSADTPFRTPRPAPRVAGEPVPVVLVDSGATDVPDGADVLRIGEDVGRGAAVNRAVAALPPDVGLVAAAPADLDWPDGVLDVLRAAADRHPRAGILAPRVLDPGGAPVPSTHPLPRPARAVLRRTWPPAPASRRRGPRRLVVGTRCCCCGGRRWTPSTASTPATRAGSTTSTSPTASPAPAG